MKYLSQSIAQELINQSEQGWIDVSEHPCFEGLKIWKYSRKTVMEKHWNEVTMMARGLITFQPNDNPLEMMLVAKPFTKFFNMDEQELPQHIANRLKNEPVTASVKYDGSLGIIFEFCGEWHVATMGSFVSDQAKWAKQYLDEKLEPDFLPEYTYLVEIIYPENRIVVPYEWDGLVLLGIFNRETEEEHSFSSDDQYLGRYHGKFRSKQVVVFESVSKLVEHVKTLDSNHEAVSYTHLTLPTKRIV